MQSTYRLNRQAHLHAVYDGAVLREPEQACTVTQAVKLPSCQSVVYLTTLPHQRAIFRTHSLALCDQ